MKSVKKKTCYESCCLADDFIILFDIKLACQYYHISLVSKNIPIHLVLSLIRKF